MPPEIITLDIETENTGYDIEKDNKRVISIQLLDGTNGKLYYENAPYADLTVAKDRIIALMQAGDSFLGFNISFDVRRIKEFLGVAIPSTQIVEITELPAMEFVRQALQRRKPRLEEVCKVLEIPCTHKEIMTKRSDKFKQLLHVIDKAKEGANKFQNERGWSYDFSYGYALDKICGGMAILDSFNEFVRTKGDTQTDFYKYAIGDIVTEKELFLKLKGIEKNTTKT